MKLVSLFTAASLMFVGAKAGFETLMDLPTLDMEDSTHNTFEYSGGYWPEGSPKKAAEISVVASYEFLT